ncbi:hypothetical protein Taro_004189 [Colocasia esculenta]|uniref:Protein FAM32A-like n=1 Tax=Colocasia esculenta TaxID=4460 RepID=A0A843TR16_COLES|nr:hypothetical protein [Colocasia esculenta]
MRGSFSLLWCLGGGCCDWQRSGVHTFSPTSTPIPTAFSPSRLLPAKAAAASGRAPASNRQMSAYENIVGGKLKLKGKALDVKSGGVKKKRKQKQRYDQEHEVMGNEYSAGGSTELSTDPAEHMTEVDKLGEERPSSHDDQLTPAEKRYIEQKEKIDTHRLAKTANKSHRDRIQDFNQYLANMSEHYDIPKVGPG